MQFGPVRTRRLQPRARCVRVLPARPCGWRNARETVMGRNARGTGDSLHVGGDRADRRRLLLVAMAVDHIGEASLP